MNIHLLMGQALSTRPRSMALTIGIANLWVTGGLVIGEGMIIPYYLRRFEAKADEE